MDGTIWMKPKHIPGKAVANPADLAVTISALIFRQLRGKPEDGLDAYGAMHPKSAAQLWRISVTSYLGKKGQEIGL
jgi:hypothetical protein